MVNPDSVISLADGLAFGCASGVLYGLGHFFVLSDSVPIEAVLLWSTGVINGVAGVYSGVIVIRTRRRSKASLGVGALVVLISAVGAAWSAYHLCM